MKLGIHTETRNRLFRRALRRLNPALAVLEERLADLCVPGRAGNVMLTFMDLASDVVRVTRRGAHDDIFEVDVGFDFEAPYAPEDDVLIAQIIETKLLMLIASEPEFSAHRNAIRDIVERWTTETVVPPG